MHCSLKNNTFQELFIINFKPSLTNYKYSKDLKFKIDYLNFNFCLFEVFESFKKISYLVTKEITNLNIYLVSDNKLYKTLKYSNEIVFFKYYSNNTDKGFLILSTIDSIFIYEPSKEFVLVSLINSKLNIKNVLLIFNIKSEDYLVYSVADCSASLIILKNAKTLESTKNIMNCNDKYLIYWNNRLNSKDYIILLCVNKVMITNLFVEEVYSEIIIEPESTHFNGFIYSKNNLDYLCFSSFNGYITIYDLYNKKTFKRISCPACKLIEIFSLSDRYFISSDYSLSEFIIIDIEQGKVISKYRNNNKDCILNIKNIYLQNFGKCILTCGTQKTIHLWKPLT